MTRIHHRAAGWVLVGFGLAAILVSSLAAPWFRLGLGCLGVGLLLLLVL